MTPDGIDFLRTAFDPFHDFQVLPAGYPDVDDARSIVLCYTQAETVSAPGTGSWDLMVWNAPLQFTAFLHDAPSAPAQWMAAPMNDFAQYINVQLADGDPAAYVSTFNVYRADSGDDLFVDDGAWAPTDFVATSYSAKMTNLLGHASRIIGLGFEVHDISAEINKQGSVTVGTVPTNTQMKVREYFAHSDRAATPPADGHYSVKSIDFMGPPSTLAQATAYPNSTTWEAKKGVYVVPRLSSVSNPVNMVEPATIVGLPRAVLPTGVAATTHVFTTTPEIVVVRDTEGSEYDTRIPGPVQFADFNTSFAFFSGLHPDGQFRVTMRSYVEYFPRHDQDLLAVATPSPGLDEKALRLYSEIARNVPVGVPVDFNAKGTWWKMVSKVIKDVAPIAAPIIGAVAPETIPFMAAGTAAYEAGKAFKAARKSKNAAKKSQQRPSNPTMGVPPRRV